MGQATLRLVVPQISFSKDYVVAIIGTGLISLPVLGGSAAYALGEAMGWPVGLAQRPGKAKALYVTIAVATAIGIAL